MAEFSSFVIQPKGHALMSKLIAGSGTCNFSAIRTSTTVYTQGQLESGLTSLTNIKQSTEISSISRINNTSVNIKGALNNKDLVTGYTVNTIGLYAIDPDEGEILYAVARAIQAGYMPPYNGITSSGILFDFVITVGNAENVTVIVNPAAVATQADVIEINAKIADLAGYVGYTDDDIVGVEVDYANRTFTRLAGAVGKTPGADFDSILAFGGRRRCNLADDGTVNAYFGDAGYIEDGSNGQVMVEQPKFYYKVVPLKMEKNDEVEIASVKFDTGATSAGNITITLNGTAYNVAVAAGDDATAVATKVRNTSFAGWTTSGSGTTVTFTANKVGAKSATTFTDTGTTGVTATVTRTQPGYIGKGFKLRKARYYVSMTKKAGFKVHPAFVKNGVEVNKIYLSAFEGSLYDVSASAYILDDAQIADFTATNGDKLSSRANAKPISGNTQDLTRRKCGILAENRGTGWSQQYAATAACSQLLFTVEYASMNSQTAIGKGVVDKASGEGNESEITGATTLLGNASGMAAGTNGLVSITYRGEENFWGNINKFTDGMNIYCDIANSVHDLYVADNTFAESTQASPYANAGITLATRSGYVSAMAYSETYDWLFVPAETLGDSALPVGDYFYQGAASPGYKVARLGGRWNYGLAIGAFSWYVDSSPSIRARYIGGRLVYVPAA
jgi:predicted heme/steroid binding protein